MLGFAQKWFPDWAWDFYRWSTNFMNARTKYPSFRRYREFQLKLRKAMWP